MYEQHELTDYNLFVFIDVWQQLPCVEKQQNGPMDQIRETYHKEKTNFLISVTSSSK